jgi:hypothetical protein
MSSTADVMAVVPMLDGSNWIIWETQMKAFLRAKGLWQITSGSEVRPPSLVATDDDTPTAEARYARRKEQIEWDNRDDQAIGYISLKITHSLRHHIKDDSAETWTSLNEAFSKQGPAAIYNDFT